MKSRFRIGYIDDITFGDHWSVVLSNFVTFKAASEKLGLLLNPSKCELFMSDSDCRLREETLLPFRQQCPDICETSLENLMILGSPIGSSALRRTLTAQLETFSFFRKRLSLLHQHDAFFLMKNCLAVPKLLYTFRTAPTFLAPNILKDIESCLRASLVEVTNTSLSDTRWKQACLPCRDGGLGIPSSIAIALCAHLASVHAALPLTARILGCTGTTPFSHIVEACAL